MVKMMAALFSPLVGKVNTRQNVDLTWSVVVSMLHAANGGVKRRRRALGRPPSASPPAAEDRHACSHSPKPARFQRVTEAHFFLCRLHGAKRSYQGVEAVEGGPAGHGEAGVDHLGSFLLQHPHDLIEHRPIVAAADENHLHGRAQFPDFQVRESRRPRGGVARRRGASNGSAADHGFLSLLQLRQPFSHLPYVAAGVVQALGKPHRPSLRRRDSVCEREREGEFISLAWIWL